MCFCCGTLIFAISHFTSCLGLQQEEPEIAYPMSFTCMGISYSRYRALQDVKLLPNQLVNQSTTYVCSNQIESHLVYHSCWLDIWTCNLTDVICSNRPAFERLIQEILEKLCPNGPVIKDHLSGVTDFIFQLAWVMQCCTDDAKSDFLFSGG